MTRRLHSALAALAVVAAGSPSSVAAAPGVASLRGEPVRPIGEEAARPAFLSDEVIVRFRPDADAGERRAAREGAGVAFERVLELPRTQVVTVEGGVRAAVERLARQTDVAFAQPNYVYRATAAAPNDPRFGELWGLRNTGQPIAGSAGTPAMDVNALEAWDHSTGSGQVIAIADTGVDLTHPDLVPNLWINPGETENGVDDDGNGVVDDVHGYDVVDADGDPNDLQYHGTHVAGTAAAAAGNATGVAGVASDARIMAVRVLDADGAGNSAGIADGIAYAGEQGADVINLSLGGPPDAGDLLVRNAIAGSGAVVVAAAGNDGLDVDVDTTTPCTFDHIGGDPPNLICVAAVDNRGALAGFSNFGDETVDVGAPGVEILSALTAYEALFSERFEADIVSTWTLEDGWHRTNAARSAGAFSLTDSVGGYGANENKFAVPDGGADLTNGVGCRMLLDVRLATADNADRLFISAQAAGQPPVGFGLSGSSGGRFEPIEFLITPLEGQPDVFPVFQFVSDGAGFADGAYVDELAITCRGATYGASSYTSLDGTSMAAPHVAGAAALVRAAAPGASEGEIVDALMAGVRALPSLAGATATGGLVDACLAIFAATGATPDCQRPGQPAGGGGGTGDGGGTGGETGGGDTGGGGDRTGDTPVPPGPASFTGVVTASARGGFSLRVRGEPGTGGSIVVTASLPRGSGAAARRVVARKPSFRIPASGRATVALRLSRPARRVLSRVKRLRTSTKVVLTNAAGLKSSRTRTVRILLKQRR